MNPSEGREPSTQIEVRIDRLVLPGRVWTAERPRALVAVVHGLGEHSGRYAAFANTLVERRFSVVALDLPGHGEAPGPRGDFPSWEFVRDQVVPTMFTVTRGLPNQPPDLPVVLFGHSLGGVIALDYALQHPKTIIGVVASAPGLLSKRPPAYKMLLARIALGVAPTAGFSHGLPENAMSRDREVLDLRKADPMVHDRISPRLYFALEQARARVLTEGRRLAVPALLLHGAADKVVDPHGSLEFNGLAPHGMSRLFSYKDAYHEIFNDPARDLAMRDLLGWLDAVLVV